MAKIIETLHNLKNEVTTKFNSGNEITGAERSFLIASEQAGNLGLITPFGIGMCVEHIKMKRTGFDVLNNLNMSDEDILELMNALGYSDDESIMHYNSGRNHENISQFVNSDTLGKMSVENKGPYMMGYMCRQIDDAIELHHRQQK